MINEYPTPDVTSC